MLPAHRDLLYMMVLAGLVLIITLLEIESVWLRALLSLPLALFGVGYALGMAIFPGKQLHKFERALLSLGLSLSTLVLTGLLLHWLPIGVQAEGWAIMLFVISIAATGLAFFRREMTYPVLNLELNPHSTEDEFTNREVGIVKDLSGLAIRGISPGLIMRISQHFGNQTIETIEKSPERLCQVSGIGPKRMEKIVRAWEEQEKINEVVLFLQERGVTSKPAVNIYKQYGDQWFEVVQSDPYRLLKDIHGLGLQTADGIARPLGLPPHHPSRIKAILVSTRRQFACWLRKIRSEFQKIRYQLNQRRKDASSRRAKPLVVTVLGLSALMVVFGASMAFMPAPQTHYEGYSMFWLAPDPLGTSGQVELGLRSMEFETQTYWIELYEEGQLVQRWEGIQLDPKQHWVIGFDWDDSLVGSGPLEAVLYRVDQPDSPYRQARLWASAN
jgi:uncharacterized membrane protein